MKIVAGTSSFLRSVKHRLIELTWPKYKFRLPNRDLPSVQVRVFKDKDLETCCQIYRLNAPNRFPDGYFELFREDLTSPNNLFLVVECDGNLVALGGIRLSQAEGYMGANLMYGIVHPENQRKGIGTVLLLARIAALPKPEKPFILGVSPVVSSRSFFTQFGFRFANHYQDKRTNKQFELLAIRVTQEDWVDCHHVLRAASVDFDVTEAIPLTPLEIANLHYVNL